MVVWLFFAVPWVCLRFLIVVFPDHTHLLFTILLEHLHWRDGLNELHVSVMIKLVRVWHYIHMYSFQNISIIIEIYTSLNIGTC